MALPNRGIVKTARNKAQLVPVPFPELLDDYMLVKTVAVALNPNDWQSLEEEMKPDSPHLLLGSDAAGIVVEVGKNVTRNFRKGDRVTGVSFTGLGPEYGTFAEYVLIHGDMAMHIPSHMSFEDASTLTGGIVTIGLGLYKHLGLSVSTLLAEGKKENGRSILIYGGSSATGTLAIQFAKLSGLTVITTASPRNFPLLKSLGADHLLDYRVPNCASTIRQLTNNSLSLVFDTISTSETAKICAEALSSLPDGLYVSLLPVGSPRQDVRSIFFIGYTVSGMPFEMEGQMWDVVPEDKQLGKDFCILAEKLIEQGKIKPHPADVRVGIEGILDGLEELKAGKVSGVKLVYRIEASG